MSDIALFLTEDGSHSLLSHRFGVSYHSRYGAIQETQHVFINAALHFKAEQQQTLSILEIGFGTGLNALMTLLTAKQQALQINYVALEAYPLDVEWVQALNYGEQLADEKAKQYFQALHQNPWNKKVALTEYFNLEKRLERFENLEEKTAFDIIYFDAFAPDAQPELWNEEMMQKMYDALLPGGVLTTYCAKGVVKRTMKQVGFKVEKLPGPPGKREMTRAVKV